MNIRTAEESDLEELCRLMAQVDLLHRQKLPHIFQEVDGPARSREYVLGLIAAENVAVFVADMDGQLVGFVNVIVRLSSDIPVLVPRCFALIENLAVDRKYRRQGVGSALLEHAHSWAVGQGASTVELNVFEFNRGAQVFYRKLGYRTESRRMSRSLGDD